MTRNTGAIYIADIRYLISGIDAREIDVGIHSITSVEC